MARDIFDNNNDANLHLCCTFVLSPNVIADPRTIEKKHEHIYIHSKMFVFDDKFAVIGSANCNNRGYNHDSEVIAGIFEQERDNASDPVLAKWLRMRLWSEHLNLELKEVSDPIACIDRWIRPSTSSSIGLYNENADSDQNIGNLIESQGDPSSISDYPDQAPPILSRIVWLILMEEINSGSIIV